MDAWIGVIGVIAGTVIGGSIAAYTSFREQKRAPRLLMLEKRMAVRSELYMRLYEIARCVHQNQPPKVMMARIKEYCIAALSQLLYVHPATREKLLVVHNLLQDAIAAKEINVDQLMAALNKALSTLVDSTDIEYK